MSTRDAVTDAEHSFPYLNLLELEYFQKYRYAYYEMPKRGFQLGPRNYLNLLKFITEIFEYKKQHANGFAKRFRSEGKDWRNCEAIFSEVIVYRYYIRPVYEGLIKAIHQNKDECDIIIETLDGSFSYLEVFCVMPNFQRPSKPSEIVVGEVKTHKQEEMSSIRQKLLQKNERQKQFSTPRDNFAVIELNDPLIAGDFTILSSLSDGYKVTVDKSTLEKVSEGYDWAESVFEDESTKFLKGIIYFSLGDYDSRKFLFNSRFKDSSTT